MIPIKYTLGRIACISYFSISNVGEFRVFGAPNSEEAGWQKSPFYIVEFNSTLVVDSDIGTKLKFRFSTRVNYNKKEKIGRLIVKPLIDSVGCEENMIEDICKCI
jgi:hypothetical protein